MGKNQNAITYIRGQIYYICQNFKDRAGGSVAERNCQRHFIDQLSAWSDSVKEEEFILHPGSFLGWIIPSSLLNVLTVLLFWMRAFSDAPFFSIMGFLCATASVLLFDCQFLLYHRFSDRLYPEKTSVNVFARLQPSGETKRRIIFGGHADAAYEMTYILHSGKKSLLYVFFGPIIGGFYVWFVSLAALIQALTNGYTTLSGIWIPLGIIAAILIPPFASGIFFINWKTIVDGANDNLSGCLVAISVLREMKLSNERLQNTEICCLITGAEEEGLRGSKAFAKKHKHDFDDVETIFIALDTLREINQLKVYTRGINGTQKNSEYVGKLLQTAGKNCGINLQAAGIYPGATDAEAFSREGLLACGLCGVDHMPQTYYHTRRDTYDNIDEDCLSLSLDICLEAVRLYDMQER